MPNFGKQTYFYTGWLENKTPYYAVDDSWFYFLIKELTMYERFFKNYFDMILCFFTSYPTRIDILK